MQRVDRAADAMLEVPQTVPTAVSVDTSLSTEETPVSLLRPHRSIFSRLTPSLSHPPGSRDAPTQLQPLLLASRIFGVLLIFTGWEKSKWGAAGRVDLALIKCFGWHW